MAAKEGGATSSWMRLALLLRQQAANMPNDNIDRYQEGTGEAAEQLWNCLAMKDMQQVGESSSVPFRQ